MLLILFDIISITHTLNTYVFFTLYEILIYNGSIVFLYEFRVCMCQNSVDRGLMTSPETVAS